MLGDLPYQRVRDAVLTHPSMGEGLNLLFDASQTSWRTEPANRQGHYEHALDTSSAA